MLFGSQNEAQMDMYICLWYHGNCVLNYSLNKDNFYIVVWRQFVGFGKVMNWYTCLKMLAHFDVKMCHCKQCRKSICFGTVQLLFSAQTFAQMSFSETFVLILFAQMFTKKIFPFFSLKPNEQGRTLYSHLL